MYWKREVYAGFILSSTFPFFRLFFLRGCISSTPFRLVLVLLVGTTCEVLPVSLTNKETKNPLVRSSPAEQRMTLSAEEIMSDSLWKEEFLLMALTYRLVRDARGVRAAANRGLLRVAGPA